MIIYQVVQCNNMAFVRSIIQAEVVEVTGVNRVRPDACEAQEKGVQTMNENLRANNGSSMYAHIEAAPMPESERNSALEALEMAEVLVDAVTWVAKKLGELVNFLFLKPGVKH